MRRASRLVVRIDFRHDEFDAARLSNDAIIRCQVLVAADMRSHAIPATARQRVSPASELRREQRQRQHRHLPFALAAHGGQHRRSAPAARAAAETGGPRSRPRGPDCRPAALRHCCQVRQSTGRRPRPQVADLSSVTLLLRSGSAGSLAVRAVSGCLPAREHARRFNFRSAMNSSGGFDGGNLGLTDTQCAASSRFP